MAHNRVGDELKLFLSALSEIEGGIQLSEGAHGVLSEAKEFLDLPANSPIRDSAQKLGDDGIFGRLRQSTQSVLRPAAEGNSRPRYLLLGTMSPHIFGDTPP